MGVKTKMKAIITLTMIALLILSACGTPDGVVTATAHKPLKIGFIGPLTGDVSNFGTDAKAGMELAIKEINDAGGINGRQVVGIYEDAKCSGKDATTAVTKLIEIDKVDFIVGGLCSAETLAAAPLAEKAKVVLISYASSSPDITKAGDYIFRTWPSDTGQGKAMAEEITKRGHKKVAVIFMNSDYNLGLATAFKQNFEKLGGQITAWETYDSESKDFRTQITKALASNLNAVYLVPYAVDGGLLIKQVRQMNKDIPLFGPESLGSKEAVEAAGIESIEGLVYATPKFDEESPKAKELLPKVEKIKGGKISLFVLSANSYDAVNLVAEALKANPDKIPTGTVVKDYLYTIKDWQGASGTLTINKNGDPLKEFQIMRVHNGEFVKV